MHTALARVSFHLLTDDQLLEHFGTAEDRLSRAVIDECVSRGERMIARLSDLVRYEGAWAEVGPRFWMPVHATFALGAFEDDRALRGLLSALRWSTRGDLDWVHEALPALFGKLGKAAIPPLRTRAGDGEVPELERATAVRSLGAIAARHPVEQGEVLDFLRGLADDDAQGEAEREAAAEVLLAFRRPSDRNSILAAAIRQGWSRRPSRFDLDDIDAAYTRPGQDLGGWLVDPLAFYDPVHIEARTLRWLDEEEDARWARGAAEDAPWVEEQRQKFLTKFEFTLVDLDDADRGDAFWVAQSMTEYLVYHENVAPWRWHGATAFAYLMDVFARRVSVDDAGRIDAVPEGVIGFARFCAERGLVSSEDRRAVEETVERERDEFVDIVSDPDRRRRARGTLEEMLSQGYDPRDPWGPARTASTVPVPVRERKTSRRLRPRP